MTSTSQNSVTLAAEETAFRQIVLDHLFRYPGLQIQDLYKLIHQAAMASEHADQDIAGARDWLERELNSLGEGPEEPAVDPISPDGGIVRVNLRPYIAAGGDPSALLAAFIRTADEHQGTLANLRRFWSYAEGMAAEGQLPFAPTELEGFFSKMEADRFPAVHHSEAYKATYHPVYRVIVREFLVW